MDSLIVSLISPIVKIADQPEDFARLLSTEVDDFDSHKMESMSKMASDWLKARRDSFLDNIACSIGRESQTMTEMVKK